MIGNDQSYVKNRWHVALIVLVLTLLAALPRFYELGSLSFYGDEETTAFAVRSQALGQGAHMPSGMPYRRALPFTWLSAVSTKIFGIENELSYRVPTALFGTLTIPLLFIMARPLVGTTIALAAALLLAGSEWHISYSRIARMYAPFAFFFTAAGFMIWRWAVTNSWRYLLASVILFMLAVSFHSLGIFAVLLVLIPIAIAGWSRVPPLGLLLFALLAGALAYLYGWHLVLNAPANWMAEHNLLPAVSAVTETDTSTWMPKRLAALPMWVGVSAFLGAALGFWTAWISRPVDEEPGAILRMIGRYTTGALMGALACAGQLYGAVFAGLMFLLLHPQPGNILLRRLWIPIGIMAFFGMTWSVWILWQYGFMDGLKTLVAFPYPFTTINLAMTFSGVFVLFTAMCVYLSLTPKQTQERPLHAILLTSLLLILTVSVTREWGGVRFLIGAYPFLLLVAAAGLVTLLRITSRHFGFPNERLVLTATVGIAVSGVLGAHGIPQAAQMAMVQHGGNLDWSGAKYPDHQAPGLFVRQHLNLDDIVIADDALQQKWYVGHVDYWLRDPETHLPYLYQANDGHLRDIYVSSAITTAKVLDELKRIKNRRLWVITSSETYHSLDFFLGEDTAQRRWFASIEKSHVPVFTARDSVTKVYCVNCGKLQEM